MSLSNPYRDDVHGAPSAQIVDDAPMPVAHAWSPAQIIGLIVGVFFAALGIAGVVRTGFNTAHIYLPHHNVWSFSHSPLLAVIEIGYGALLILSSVVPGGARWLMGLLGAVAVVFGIVIVAGNTPVRLHNWLAVTHRNGWLFLICGAVVTLAAILSPVFLTGTRRRHARHLERVA